LTLFSQVEYEFPSDDEGFSPLAVPFKDKFIHTTNDCYTNIIRSTDLGGLVFSYSIVTSAPPRPSNNSLGASRHLMYVFMKQIGNTGFEQEVARTYESEATQQMGTGSVNIPEQTLTIYFGGSNDIPKEKLTTGKYRIKLVVNYEFLPRTSVRNDDLLIVESQRTISNIETRFNGFPPPNPVDENDRRSDIVIDETFACIDYIACQQITDFRVDYTQNGDFIFGNISPQGNYQIGWTQAPGEGNFTGVLTNPDGSTRVICPNNLNSPNGYINYRIRVEDPSNGCVVSKIYKYDGTFRPLIKKFRIESPSCISNGFDDFTRRIKLIGGDAFRVQSANIDYGDGSPIETNVISSWLDPNVLHFEHQFPVNVPQTCFGVYTLNSFNGCVSDERELQFMLPLCGSPMQEETVDETTISPNPVSTTLAIKMKTGEILESVEILDVSGKVVFIQKNIGETMKYIDMNSFNNGLFIVKVKNEEGWEKIIKVVKN
jgi:hypothetical protein